MVRTQIQLTEEQAERLRDIAARRRTSLAALVREGVEHVIEVETTREPSREELKRRALAIVGTLESGIPDLAVNHDYYLEEAYAHDGVPGQLSGDCGTGPKPTDEPAGREELAGTS